MHFRSFDELSDCLSDTKADQKVGCRAGSTSCIPATPRWKKTRRASFRSARTSNTRVSRSAARLHRRTCAHPAAELGRGGGALRRSRRIRLPDSALDPPSQPSSAVVAATSARPAVSVRSTRGPNRWSPRPPRARHRVPYPTSRLPGPPAGRSARHRAGRPAPFSMARRLPDDTAGAVPGPAFPASAAAPSRARYASAGCGRIVRWRPSRCAPMRQPLVLPFAVQLHTLRCAAMGTSWRTPSSTALPRSNPSCRPRAGPPVPA